MKRFITTIAVCLVVAPALTACSGASDAVTISESKSTVQLLRNVIADTIDDSAIQGVTKNDDAALACGDEPDEDRFFWRSSVLLDIVGASDRDIEGAAAGAVAALEKSGWISAEADPVAHSVTVELTSTESLATIRITSTDDADGDGRGASVFVVVNGPCVKTAGADSAEMKALVT